MSYREAKKRADEYLQHRRFLIAQSERSAGVSPDEAAKRRQTAQRLGVSTQAVNDAPENAVLREQLDKIWRDTQDSDALRRRMMQPDFYDVAKDDTGELSVVGELANSAGRGFFKGLNNLAAAATDRKTFDAGVKHLIRAMPLGRELGGLPDIYNSVLIPPTKDKLQAGNLPALPKLNIPAASDLIPEDVLRRFNERRAKDYVGFDNWTNKHFSPSARLQKDREGFAKTEGFGDAAAYILTHPYMTANVSAESFGQFVPALAATAATRNPAVGAAVMGTGSFATEYAATLAETAEENAAKLSGLGREEALARVLSDPAILDAAREKAAKRGLAVGLFDGMTAGLAGRLLSGARSVSGAAARSAGEAGIQMAGGAAGEAAAQAVTGEWTPREIVMEAFAEIPTAPVEGYRNFQEGRLKAKEAQEHARHMQQQADAVASSKLTARAPDLQADFVNESYGEEGNKIFFDGEALMQSGLAETVAQAIPYLAPQIEAAAATGGMVEMTRGDFHAFLPQEAQHHLASIARLSPDAFSAAEAQAWEESEAAAEFEDMAKRAQEDAAAALRERQAFDALKAQFKGELLDTGRMDAKGADDAASLWASHVQAYAGRLNLSPEAFMERYGRLNVVGDSLTREGVFSQALASAPPKGWVHSTNPQDVIGLWDDTTSARAIFWTGIDNQVAVEAADASDYSHSISADVVRHIKNRHGNDADGQLPVTAEDLVKIPEIIANHDEVRTNLQNPKTGGQRVAYAKRSEDSLLIYLEEYVRSRNNLKGVSMWKYPPTADVGNVLAHITRPSLYVRNGVAAYDDTTADAGNNQDVLFQSATEEARQFSADDDSILYQDARGMFDRMADTIALLKNADASTFIHEFGHFELEVMSRIERDLRTVPQSEMTESERQVLADFQTALDWFGVKDADTWAAMSLEEQREHHEKFARGMEAYLFEGKAPSEALRGVFSRVARLLKRIYRSLLNLNVELSDDIRGVFDRLLASDGQIAETSYINGATLLFAEDAEFQAMDEAARREAEDELGRRALRDMAFSRNARSREIRRLKKEYKTDFARAEMDARRSIMKQPVYRAWQLLTAKMTDENRIDGNSKEEREFRRKAKVLQGKPVYTIETRRSPSNFKELRAWASQVFAEAGNKAVNPEIGEIVFNDKSVKDSVAHSMNPFKAAAFEAVPDVIRSGVVVAQAEHGAMRSHYISAPVKIEGVEDIVTVLVREDVNSRRMYLHSVITKEKLLNAGDTETADVGRETGQVNSGVLPTTQDSIADTDVSQPHGKLQSEDVASVLRSYLKYKPKTDRTALDPSSDTLMAAIAKLGGLNKDELMREWGLDAKDKIPAPVFGMPVLRRSKGRSIDEMAELLAEEGYLPTDNGKADVRDLEERFSDGLSGRDWYSRHYVPREERKAGEDVANPFALTAVRLDEDSLSGLPADWAQVLQERGMTAKTGGMHADLAAGLILDENGEPVFADGVELAQALAEALPPQEEIERTAMLNLLAEKGEVPTQADFEEAADLAVHNGLRARIIAAELNRLNEAVGSAALLKQAAKVLAKERVAQIKTRDLRPSVFTRQEAAAAKAAEKAFKAGDTETAAAHKRSQLIQNALARETLLAREEMEKTRKYLAKFDRVQTGVDIAFREQIEALLEDVELRPLSLKETDRRKSAYQFVREMEEAGIQHSIDPEYVDTISRKSWREMTVEEMRGLADTVRQLEHLGRLKNRLLSNQAKRSYQEVRDELAGVLEASSKVQGRKAKVRREAATRWEKSAQWLSGVWWGHLKISTIARIFDDGKDNGAFFRHFILPLKQAADREATMTAEAAEKLYAVLQPLAKHTGRLKGMLEQKRDYQGLGRLTREQLFAVALNMGNAGNLQRLLDGSGWHLVDVERAVSTLTAEEWHAVQSVWDLLESYRPQIAALERRMTGVEPDWVEARPFKIMSADGVEVELRGGYYPAKYDLEADGAAEKNEASTEALAQAGAAGLAAATRRTFTKQRADQVKGRPLRLSLTVAYDAVNEIIHDLTHREAVADANRLLNSHTLDTLIRQHYGAAAKRQLTKAVKDIAAGNSGAAQALDTISARLRQNVSVAGLGFNVTSAAMQLTGIVPAMTRLGAGYTAKAMMTYFAHPVASTRGANELSEMMANRTRTRFRELNEVANSVNGSDGIIRRYAYWMMMRMQQIVDTIVWHGAMMKAQDAGMAQEDAVQVADQTVLDTQGGGQAKDLSALERGGATTKLFTVFYSYMNTALNMGAATAMTERNKGKMAAHLLLQWVVPTALTALFKSLLTPGDDDDDLAKKLAKEQISFMLGMFVGGRELAQMGDIATGGKFYGYNGPSGVRPIADTYKLAQQARQGEFDKGLATATINLLGSGFGLPSAQINRTIKGAEALNKDKTDNPAALLFGYEGKK
jgi:bbp10